MSEQSFRHGDIELCYETFGDPAAEPMLMIMGLAAQMIYWDDELCTQLADRGFHVIRFDNRDIGRSTHLKDHRPPSVKQLVLRRVGEVAYTLDDMADDAVALLDHLDIEAAHVVGASMGGMIAQQIAVRHPDRVLTLTSIMSTTGDRRVGQASKKLWPIFARKPARTREAYVALGTSASRLIGTPGTDPERVADLLGRAWDRGYNPAGAGRQLAAILAAGDRTQGLRTITAPTLVIHGTKDRLVNPSGGRATVKAIPGARLELVEGMAHDLPPWAWPQILDAIALHAQSDREYEVSLSGQRKRSPASDATAG